MATDIRTIVALIALPEEYSIFQKQFPVLADHSTDRHIRLEHDAGNASVRLISILAEQMGSQSALHSADEAVSSFSPDMIVVLGIAGGLSDDINIGDVCISNQVMDVLHNTKVLDRDGHSDITFAPDFYHVDAELVASFTFLSLHPSLSQQYNDWRVTSAITDDAIALDDAVNSDGPLIHVGPIACGPVVASDAFINKLKALHRKVMAIETESGGVFSRLTSSGIPAVAIRGISDKADADKAELERRTAGGARRIAMVNACGVLRMQLLNPRFTNVAIRYAIGREKGEVSLFPSPQIQQSVVAELDDLIRTRLKDLSVEFRTRPDSFYLPMPRARRLSYVDDMAGKKLDDPEPLVECLANNQRVLVRISRSYPSQSLGWSLAHSLIRQQLNGKIVLPIVIQGEAINPPKDTLYRVLPEFYRNALLSPEFQAVVIIEEPLFTNRNRLKFLSETLGLVNAKYLIITKTDDSVAAVDDFVTENQFIEFELSPVSFSETAFFLEKSFDMSPGEAEAIAIRLDDTFRRFRLDAHPTYFAGLQEETLAALINANKRAELIQLAVDGLLTLMVAADRTSNPLSRTTRERFLKKLVIEGLPDSKGLSEEDLISLATRFLSESKFAVSAIEFLTPFFEIGILYRCEANISFTHPYLESYLLAEALRENQTLAKSYFDPKNQSFNFYAFDLYCEMGPSEEIIDNVIAFGKDSLHTSNKQYSGEHIYLDTKHPMTALSGPKQLQNLSSGLMSTAERLEADESTANIRNDKQQILDARRYVRSEVGSRQPNRQEDMPEDIKAEFDALDGLWRALNLAATMVGSGAESITGQYKVELSNLVLNTAERFSDFWTRNRLRVNFEVMRNEVLSDDNIWRVVEEFGVEESRFDAVKSDLEVFIHGFELNHVLEPMGRTLWKISSLAGVPVLAPVLAEVEADSIIKQVIRSAWLIDIDPGKGRDSFKIALSNYNGAPVLRIVLANHLLWRTFWHHYRTAGARHFINTARRALRGIGMVPSDTRVDQVTKGPSSNT